MLFKQILIGICCLIIGYLFGSISSGIIISKKFFKKDVRDFGSKNVGGTNMGRVFGKKAGLIVIMLDMLKTIIPIWLAYFILKYTPLNQYNMSYYGYLIAGLGAVIGHCYPVFFGFKGGKAVASFSGFVIATCWFLVPIGLILFLLILKIQKKVSLTSILFSLISSLLSFMLIILPDWFMNFGMEYRIGYSISLLICSIILAIRHKDNIKRIINGTESKITWMK